MVAISIVAVIFLSFVAIAGAHILTRHRERVLLIDKGLKAEDVRTLYERHPFRINPLSSLKWGLILVGAGVAFVLAMFADRWYNMEEGIYFGLIAVFAGLALLLFYRVASKKTEA